MPFLILGVLAYLLWQSQQTAQAAAALAGTPPPALPAAQPPPAALAPSAPPPMGLPASWTTPVNFPAGYLPGCPPTGTPDAGLNALPEPGRTYVANFLQATQDPTAFDLLAQQLTACGQYLAASQVGTMSSALRARMAPYNPPAYTPPSSTPPNVAPAATASPAFCPPPGTPDAGYGALPQAIQQAIIAAAYPQNTAADPNRVLAVASALNACGQTKIAAQLQQEAVLMAQALASSPPATTTTPGAPPTLTSQPNPANFSSAAYQQGFAQGAVDGASQWSMQKSGVVSAVSLPVTAPTTLSSSDQQLWLAGYQDGSIAGYNNAKALG